MLFFHELLKKSFMISFITYKDYLWFHYSHTRLGLKNTLWYVWQRIKPLPFQCYWETLTRGNEIVKLRAYEIHWFVFSGEIVLSRNFLFVCELFSYEHICSQFIRINYSSLKLVSDKNDHKKLARKKNKEELHFYPEVLMDKWICRSIALKKWAIL